MFNLLAFAMMSDQEQQKNDYSDRIDNALVYISQLKSKINKKRNKSGLFQLNKLENILLGKEKD